jgi:outer membrane protein OmpA-like peptidoglycan-associated protein
MNKIFTLLAVLSVPMLSPLSAQENVDELSKVRKDRERLIDLALTLEADFGRTLQDYTELQKDYARLLKTKSAPDQSAKVQDLQNKLKQALAKLAEKKPVGPDPRTQALLEQDMVNLRNELHRQRQELLVARARLVRADQLQRQLDDSNKGRDQATKELKQIKTEYAKLLNDLKTTMAKLEKAEQGHKGAIAKIASLQKENLDLKTKIKTQDAEIARLRPIEEQHKKAMAAATELEKEQARLSEILTEREKQLANLKSHLAAEVKRTLEIPVLIQAKNELEKKLNDSSASNEELKKNNEVLGAKRLELEKKIKDAEKNIVSMRAQLEKNEKAMASVAKLNTTNNRLVAEQALLQNTVDMAKAELVKAKGLRNRLEAELAESKKMAADAEEIKNKNAALLEEQAIIRDRLMATEKSFKLLKADRDKLETAYRDLEQAKTSLTQEITKRNDELQKLRTELAKEPKVSGDAAELEKEKAVLEARLKKREEELTNTRKELGKLQINATVLEKQLVSLKRTTASIDPVRYAKGEADVTMQQARVLSEVQQVLKLFPSARFEIVGHTCDIGSANGNLKLSQQRAKSLHDFLLSKGIQAARLKFRGVGETEPAVPNTSEANRRQNRRVEVEILD